LENGGEKISPPEKGETALDTDKDILAKAKTVYRETLSTAEESALYEMGLAAHAELERRLRDGVTVESIYDEFVRAAGVLAASMFVSLDCAGADSFTAGSVTLKRGGASSARKAAASLRSQAELMLAGYLRDGAFCFGAVRA